MSSIDVPLTKRGFGTTMRRDNWWVEPLLIFLGYLVFLIYANYAVLVPQCGPGQPCYEVPGTNYLAPLYSPLIFSQVAPSWWPTLLPYSAAMFIMWAPAGFRLTCYYYRGAYYKGFWADPPSCAVGEPRSTYWGERKFPLILQNLHRYFLYLAIIFVGILTYDAWNALWFPNPATGQNEFGIGLGTVIMFFNPILIGMYTFGCHSFRHLMGGARDVLSDAPARKKCYDCVSHLNKHHMKWAWISMFYVWGVDVYIRLCAMGILHDVRFF